LFLQYFDTVGWVLKTVSQITYTVSVETLNPAQSINQSMLRSHLRQQLSWWSLPLWLYNCIYGTCCVTTCLRLLLDNYCCCYQKPSSYV